MFKKSLFFAILIMIFTVFLFPEEKDEKEYDDVILYGDEKIELKQEKLDFIPKEAQKITIKEDMSFELSTHQADSLDADFINSIIDKAVEQSVKDNISGKDTTPYLLKKIVEETQGKSLEANLSLVYNNAKVGARLAKAYYHLLSK